MAQTEPQFKVGDRVFSHYCMDWGTIVKIDTTYRDQYSGGVVNERNRLPDTTWYEVKFDKKGTFLMDDAHGNWDMARIVPPNIAKRYGYGGDPMAA